MSLPQIQKVQDLRKSPQSPEIEPVEIGFDKLSFDKLSFDKLSFDKLSFDKLSLRKS